MTIDVTCNLFLNQRHRLNYRPKKKYDFSIAKNLLMRFQVLDSKKNSENLLTIRAHFIHLCSSILLFQHVSR